MHSILQFFVPNNEQFYSLVERQAENCTKAAITFVELVANFDAWNAEERKKKIDELKGLERAGDKLQHTLASQLQTSFVTPIDRDFLYQLSILLEERVDLLFETARKVRDFQVERLPEKYAEQAGIMKQTVEKVQKGVMRLRRMANVEDLHREVHDLEEEADKLYSEAMHGLFSGSKDAKEILIQKELYEGLEEAIDKSKQIMELLKGIVISHA